MLDALFGAAWPRLVAVPFDEFAVEFEDGRTLRVQRTVELVDDPQDESPQPLQRLAFHVKALLVWTSRAGPSSPDVGSPSWNGLLTPAVG
jgi:hypothetical protein